MEIAVDGTGKVIQYGQGIGTPDGCTLVELTDAQEQAFLTALAQPGGGVTYANGTFTALPAPPSPVAPNPNQPLIDAIQKATDLASLQANMVAVLQPGPNATAQPIMVTQPAA